MSKQARPSLLGKILPAGCCMLVIGVILVGIAFLALFSGDFGAFIVLIIVGAILMLIWPLFMKLRGIPRGLHAGGKGASIRGPMFFVRIGGPIPNGGSVAWLLMWGVTTMLLAFNVIVPATPFLLGSTNFVDLALQASISSLISFPGIESMASLDAWIPVFITLAGGFVAGLIARQPAKGLAAAGLSYLFTTIFLLFFAILFLAFEIDLNLVWAFIGAQLTTRWASGIGLLVSVPILLLGGLLGGLVTRAKGKGK